MEFILAAFCNTSSTHVLLFCNMWNSIFFYRTIGITFTQQFLLLTTRKISIF
uniref:Uncharacterized protein n=1 Tax=Rhodnius prolixus TaxID=13249 RepID=T1HX15_RHOPR